jgi:hypothetical protein
MIGFLIVVYVLYKFTLMTIDRLPEIKEAIRKRNAAPPAPTRPRLQPYTYPNHWDDATREERRQ